MGFDMFLISGKVKIHFRKKDSTCIQGKNPTEFHDIVNHKLQ